jgi:hypothetical protein
MKKIKVRKRTIAVRKRLMMLQLANGVEHYRLQITDDAEDAELIRQVNIKYAELFRERYKKRITSHFDNIEGMANGFLGERMFQSALNELRIPYLHDEMALKLVEDRVYGGDFILYKFNSKENLSIEIKTRDHGDKLKPHDCMLVKQSTWDASVKAGLTPDVVVGLRLTSDGLNAEIMGWTEGCNIVELNDKKAADWICSEKCPCYAIPYDALHKFAELIPQLKLCSMDLQNFGKVINNIRQHGNVS